jgi:ubiquinone/menaquinone biosynthesis C-methylase UbiE
VLPKPEMSQHGLLRLFYKSVLKQQKYNEITRMLGPTDHLCCLDIGADNGVLSFLLRQHGGMWKSADLDEQVVQLIRSLVETDVYQIDGRSVPFEDNSFDRVVIIDVLEHIHTDKEFIIELHRILKPGGILIINVPHIKNSLLRQFRLWLGQTDELHGHVRYGYTVDSLRQLLGDRYKIETHKTYSKFFSEFIDTLIRQAVAVVKRRKNRHGQKGHVVTSEDLTANEAMFKLYSLIYPIVWLISKLDSLLFLTSGYMLIVKAQVNK